jgi:hypothetical protein
VTRAVAAVLTRAWPRTDRIGVAALLVAICALVFTLVEYPSAFRSVQNRADASDAQTALQRQLAGALAIDVSSEFLEQARALVPKHATYYMRWGDHVRVTTPVTLGGVAGYTQFFLLPRRQAVTEKANWLLCYGCDLSDWQGRIKVLWTDNAGILIARVLR